MAPSKRPQLTTFDTVEQIDAVIAKLERRAEPLRQRLAPLERDLAMLSKLRQAKLAGKAGGKAKRKSKHDIEKALEIYDRYGGRGALKHTVDALGIPTRTMSRILLARQKNSWP